jgi:hypothetical protein
MAGTPPCLRSKQAWLKIGYLDADWPEQPENFEETMNHFVNKSIVTSRPCDAWALPFATCAATSNVEFL